MSPIAPTQSTTIPAPSSAEPGPDPADPELYRFTVDQYLRMGDAGILTEDDRVELVEGLIYRKPMRKGPQSIACREAFKHLDRLVPANAYFVTCEDPVTVPGWESTPEPDISIVRGALATTPTSPAPETFLSSSRSPPPGAGSLMTGARNGRPISTAGSPCTGSST